MFTDDVRRLALSVLAVLALSACADDAAPADTDTGSDSDVTTDGESDAPESDADEDTSTDAGEDATVDGGSDSGSDAATGDTSVEDTAADVADVAEDTTTDVSFDDADVSVEDTSDAGGDDVGEDIAEPDTETDAGSTGCIAPALGDLVINEVLPSPATGNAGDANCDGTRNAVDDEFIEIVNVSDRCVELAGVGVETGSDGLQYTFGLDTGLQPGHAIVLFGGGAPVFDGTSTQALTHCIPLNDCGISTISALPGSLGLAPEDIVALRYDSAILDSVEWGGTGVALIAGESLTRSPELTGEFVSHTTISAGVTMSPGTAANGTEWGICVD